MRPYNTSILGYAHCLLYVKVHHLFGLYMFEISLLGWWARSTRSARLITVAGLAVRETRRQYTDSSIVLRSVPHNLGVNSARDTVVQLGIQFRKYVAA